MTRVEGAIGGVERVEVDRLARRQARELSGCLAQAHQVGRGHALAEAADDEWLQRLADLEDVAHEVVIDRAHTRALIGIGDNEALALEAPQRLAHRVCADRIALGELLGLEPGARLKHAGDDVAPEIVGDPVGQAGTLGHRLANSR